MYTDGCSNHDSRVPVNPLPFTSFFARRGMPTAWPHASALWPGRHSSLLGHRIVTGAAAGLAVPARWPARPPDGAAAAGATARRGAPRLHVGQSTGAGLRLPGGNVLVARPTATGLGVCPPPPPPSANGAEVPRPPAAALFGHKDEEGARKNEERPHEAGHDRGLDKEGKLVLWGGEGRVTAEWAAGKSKTRKHKRRAKKEEKN